VRATVYLPIGVEKNWYKHPPSLKESIYKTFTQNSPDGFVSLANNTTDRQTETGKHPCIYKLYKNRLF